MTQTIFSISTFSLFHFFYFLFSWFGSPVGMNMEGKMNTEDENVTEENSCWGRGDECVREPTWMDFQFSLVGRHANVMESPAYLSKITSQYFKYFYVPQRKRQRNSSRFDLHRKFYPLITVLLHFFILSVRKRIIRAVWKYFPPK